MLRINYRVSYRLLPFVLALTGAKADPSAVPPPAPPASPPIVLPTVFCFRITDIEKLPGDATGNGFRFEFEVLNWTNTPATGLRLMAAAGTTNVNGVNPTISGAAIDPDGRGGPYQVGGQIGPGVFDAVAIHSGRGRGDIPGLLNDWTSAGATATTAGWNAGTAIPNRDLLGATSTAAANALVPGLGFDALGDLAVDGGPGPYAPAAPPAGGGAPAPGTGNVLDGFVLDVMNFNEGEILSFNWFLTAGGVPIGLPAAPPGAFNRGAFGFGTFNLMRIPIGAPAAGPAIYVGNTGMVGTASQFAQVPLPVNIVLDPAQFVMEQGVGITAPFLRPTDNIFNAVPNTSVVPDESLTAALFALALAGLLGCRRVLPRKTALP